MRQARLVYQDWIVELGFDPANGAGPEGQVGGRPEDDRAELVSRAVRSALEKLSADERELIERVHFMGESLANIASKSGRAPHKLEAMHQRALRKLRRLLATTVEEVYGVKSEGHADCPVCNSGHRAEIDALISRRDRSDTWRPVMKAIRREYGIVVRCPQVLIGHEKYH